LLSGLNVAAERATLSPVTGVLAVPVMYRRVNEDNLQGGVVGLEPRRISAKARLLCVPGAGNASYH